MTEQKLKIGLACYPTYGGSGAVATELGIALADAGHAVHFLSYETPFRLSGFHSNIIYHQVGVPEYPLFKYPPYALALATTMAEVCETHDLDIMHVHYAIPHLVSANLARDMVGRNNIKVVVTLHGTDVTVVGNDPSYRRVMAYSLEQADGITAVSRFLEKETLRSAGVTLPVRVIPNFVDMERFLDEPCPEATKLRHPGEGVVVHVSNFRPVKRVLDLVEAFAVCRSQRPLCLWMVGDGPDRAAAEARAQELGVADAVKFLGSQDDIERILPCADLFVLPSEFESFGLSALEAMACGVPVVATQSGGLPEVVEDGVTGRLVPVGDITALAGTISGMFSHPEQMKAMGEAARRRAFDLFRRDRVVPRYLSFYRELLGQGGEVQDVAAT